MNGHAQRVCSTLALAILCTLPGVLAAQNLLINGSFEKDLGLSGWEFPDSTPVWSSFDIDASPDSGSAYAINTEADPDTQLLVLSQCVPITQAGLYIVGAHGYVDTGQSTGDIAAGFAVDLNHTDCSGGYSIISGNYIPSAGQWGSYSSGTALRISSPPPSLMSVEVYLRIDKTDAGGSFAAYFDDISLVRDTIFIGDFEQAVQSTAKLSSP